LTKSRQKKNVKLWNKERTASIDADTVKRLHIMKLEVLDVPDKLVDMRYVLWGHTGDDDFFEFGVFKTQEALEDYAAMLKSLITKREREG
jgi:hypothetical protein